MSRLRQVVVVTVAVVAAVLVSSVAAASADSLAVSCNGAACNESGAWQYSPVAVVWSVSPAPTKSQGCLSTSYTDWSGMITCEVWWGAGGTAPDQSITFPLSVETGNPTATAVLARPPDANGWYNHPVSVSFAGSSFSGIASCAAPVTYSGPAASNASVTGQCIDNAGKTASANTSFKYDATPPSITGATPSRPPDYDGYYTSPVSFTFTGTDAVSGISSCQTMTYSGPASGSLVGGCWDQAGNYASMSVAVPYIQHVSTAARASIASMKPVILQWKAKHSAAYYNVQIYRDGHKVLSKWPATTSLLLKRSWRFDGRRFRLKAGSYHWYVWPGYGSRAADHYGRMLVSAAFTVG